MRREMGRTCAVTHSEPHAALARIRRKKQERPRAAMHPNIASPRGPRCEVFPGFLPRSRTDHQIIRAARRAVGEASRGRGVAPHWTTRPDSRAVNLRYVQSERQSDRASSRRHAFGRIVMFINLVSHKFCGSSFAIGKRVGLSVHCCGRAPGREVRDCDAMACSC
jgi:hypothetical protein